MPNQQSPRSAPPPDAAVKRAEHQLTRLLAMSFDGAASPSITLKALVNAREDRDHPYGWGFAWYPAQTSSALVVKDPTSIGDNPLTKLLRDWERFASTVFLCHLRGAARTLQEQDTHPFSRSYAGRDWVLAHNGDLFGDLEQELPLGEDPVFEPVGNTDSEHAFCWLMRNVRELRARRLADVGWPTLLGWFRQLDALGTSNFMLTDGVDLVVYSDSEGYNGLQWSRLKPPHATTRLETHDIEIDLQDAEDRSRTLIVVATQPMSVGAWTPIGASQMLVLRRGAVLYDSSTDPEARAPVVTRARQRSFTPSPHVAPTPMQEVATQVPGRSMPPPRPSHDPVSPLVLARRSIASDVRILSVVHDTRYRYERQVERSAHLYRLRPVHDVQQEVLQHELTLTLDGLRRDYEDVFGNRVTGTEIEEPYSELRITSRSVVRLQPGGSSQLLSPRRRFSIPLVWMPWQRQMMLPYLLPPELPETQLTELYDFAMTFVARRDSDLVQTLLDLNMTIYRDFAYRSGSTTLETTPFEVYCRREGVCQDFANLLICLARLLGIPARYRVGYIFTNGVYENKMQSEASHAWAELYLPWTGWQGFDPTNGCLVGRDHVRVACGRNYRDATPTSGTIYKGGGFETLSVDVRVEEIEG